MFLSALAAPLTPGMVAVGGRYDALLRALWPLAHPPFHGHSSPGVPYYGAVPPPGAVGATLNVERIIAGVSQQRAAAAAAAAAGQQAAGLLGVGGMGGIGSGLESSKVGPLGSRLPSNLLVGLHLVVRLTLAFHCAVRKFLCLPTHHVPGIPGHLTAR